MATCDYTADVDREAKRRVWHKPPNFEALEGALRAGKLCRGPARGNLARIESLQKKQQNFNNL